MPDTRRRLPEDLIERFPPVLPRAFAYSESGHRAIVDGLKVARSPRLCALVAKRRGLVGSLDWKTLPVAERFEVQRSGVVGTEGGPDDRAVPAIMA